MIEEIFKDALPLIKQFAPVVGSAIGGPYTGFVLQVLTEVFNQKKFDLDDLANIILHDPDVQNKLELIEKDHGRILYNLIKKVENNPPESKL